MPRLAGKSGAVYIAGAAGTYHHILDTFNWTLEVMQEVAEAGIKFEPHEVYAMGRITSRVTVERYIDDDATAVATALADSGTQQYPGASVGGTLLNRAAPVAGNNYKGVLVTFKLFTIDQGSAAPGKGFAITGSGIITRISDANPRTLATETWEITCNALPVFTV